ncbi:MAG TPA: response regulator [Polyangiales bacterium]
MMAGLSLDPDLQHKLSRDCAEHEQTVASLIAAQREGALDAELAFRECAMELHSVKGVASVLELKAVLNVIGSLSEQMLRTRPSAPRAFLDEFASWFPLLVRCLCLCAKGACDPTILRAAQGGQSVLSQALAARSRPVAQRAPISETFAISPSAGRRLLVVDDSATIRAALCAQLRERGYPVRAASNLTETGELLRSFAPEIVVTDVHMPDVEGDELCRHIKSRMQHVVPVVLYSILPEERLAQVAEAAGADAYVHKGAGVKALIQRMDELLSDEILF